MSRIRGKNTGPERIVRSVLHRMGFRFRLHDSRLVGKPDIVLRRHRKVVFVNGCFWHGHKHCPDAVIPKTRIRFWSKKIKDNQTRDARAIRELGRLGWGTLVVWECELKAMDSTRRRLSYFLSQRTIKR